MPQSKHTKSLTKEQKLAAIFMEYVCVMNRGGILRLYGPHSTIVHSFIKKNFHWRGVNHFTVAVLESQNPRPGDDLQRKTSKSSSFKDSHLLNVKLWSPHKKFEGILWSSLTEEEE